ncbi:MAG TPA: PEGA domain-containing protein [Kofleriaceae bacterium]
MRGLALLVVVAFAVSAHAQPAAPKPWAVGVSDVEQTRALDIYKRANAEFEEARYAQALAMYREAITHWDHPAIRFNMVVCLVNLDQPLEAFDDLEIALKYGAGPIGAAVYEQALTYQKLLLGQLAKIKITSQERGAEITLDGAKLFTAPGSVTKLVMPGTHQVVATKAGFLTTTTPLVLLGGKTATADVELTRLAATAIVRRWSAWKPWVVLGAGAVVAATAGVLEWRSHENFESYDTSFAAACSTGCGGPGEPAIPSALASLEHRAKLENEGAVAMFAVGGAALAVGIIGVILNQPYAATLEKNMTITPVVSAREAGIFVGGAF